jgi:Flp pilus assembly protein TadD
VTVRGAVGVLLVALLLGAQTIEQLQEAVRLSPSDAEAHGRLGIALRKAGRLADAAAALTRSIELRPDSRLKVLLAFTYLESGQCGTAVPLLNEAFAAEQKDALKSVIGQRLIECDLEMGTLEEALSHAQALRRIAPHDANVLYLSSKVYMALWNGAFQTLLNKAPGSYHVRLIQAEALEAQERFGEAVHEYRAVLKIAPQLGGIHYRLGRALMLSQPDGKGDAEARIAFQRELEINPFHVAALIAMADIHARNGERQQASERFAEAIRLQPSAVPARVGIAKMLIVEKQWTQALEHLEAAAKVAPHDETIHYNLMLAYRGLGRVAEAKHAFETFGRLKEQKRK